MARLMDVSFRDYGKAAYVIEFTPDDKVIAQLDGGWDLLAGASVVYPYIDGEAGITLELLCPYSVSESRMEDEYDVLAASKGRVSIRTDDDTSDASNTTESDPMGCRLLDTIAITDAPPAIQAHCAAVDPFYAPDPDVLATRADVRLDPFRHPFFPDDVRVVMPVGDRGEHCEEVWGRLVSTHHDDAVPDMSLFEATLLNETFEKCAVRMGERMIVGFIWDDDAPAPRGLLGLPMGTVFDATPTADDYTPATDEESGGGLSLDIGAGYYEEGMNSDGAHSRECFQEAEHWYQVSAGMGNVQAACNLGYIYAFGRTGERDYDEAARWLAKAADADNAEACYKLGDLCSHGQGVPCDPTRARSLYEHAFELAKADDYTPVWGSAALRLAQGDEADGDATAALDLYVEAEAGLSDAVDMGQGWYERSLQLARDGIDRLTKEGLVE